MAQALNFTPSYLRPCGVAVLLPAVSSRLDGVFSLNPMESTGVGEVKLNAYEQAMRQNVRRIAESLEARQVDTLASADNIMNALDECAAIVERLDGDLSALFIRVQGLTAARNSTFRLLHRACLIFEKRYGQTYLVARRRANSVLRGKSLKRYLLSQSGGKCQRCSSASHLSIDHIIPVKRGGGNDLANLQILCRSCNSKKGTTI